MICQLLDLQPQLTPLFVFLLTAQQACNIIQTSAARLLRCTVNMAAKELMS